MAVFTLVAGLSLIYLGATGRIEAIWNVVFPPKSK